VMESFAVETSGTFLSRDVQDPVVMGDLAHHCRREG
jgi:hypothetical protein